MIRKLHPGEIISIVSAILLGISAFLPWAKVEVLGIQNLITGIQGDGDFQLALAGAVLILSFTRKITLPIAIGIIGILVIVPTFASLESLMSGDYSFTLLILLAIVLISSSILYLSRKSRHLSALLFSLISVVILVIDYSTLSGVNTQFEGASTFAYGFYLMTIAILGLLLGNIMALSSDRKAKK